MQTAMAFLSFLGALVAFLPMGVLAASTTKTTSTTQFFLPSRSTSSGYHIYATPITSDASTTQYLLACQTQFSASSYTCGGDFTGLTLTYGPSTMHLNFGQQIGLEYDCALSKSPVVCTITSSGIVASSTVLSLAAAETSKSTTAVTVLDDGKKATKSTTSSTTTHGAGSAATTTSSSGGNGVCKRKVTGGSGNGATADGATAAGAGATDAAATTTGSSSGDGCSAGSSVKIGLVMWGVTALSVLIGMVVL